MSDHQTTPAPTLSVHRDAPAWDGRRTAALGGLRFPDPATGAGLIAGQLALLREEGFEAVVGPMDGSTWYAYRYVTFSDGSPPFLMEPPDSPAERLALLKAGFEPVATYASARAALNDLGARPEPGGVRVEAWDGRDPERFMADIFALSCEAFSRNPFYKPLVREGFDALYQPLLSRIDPRLMLFARGEDDALLGFVFGLPDLLDPASNTAILKTYASRRRGVGHLLAHAFHRAARDAGFVQVIHALMHDGNQSLERSGQHRGEVFRRYAVFGRLL